MTRSVEIPDPLFSLSDRTVRRFWSKTGLPDPENGCQLWLGRLDYKGYGQFVLDPKIVRAHRVACWLAHGQPAAGRTECAHSCRNRHCVAPTHLRWATALENQRDRIRDGTSCHGIKSGTAKLTEDQVLAIVSRVRQGATYQMISDEFGIVSSQVSRIMNGQAWGHVTGIARKAS